MSDLLADGYSLAYAVANAAVLRLWSPALICLAYLSLEVVLPRSRNSLASYLRAGHFLAISIVVNTVLLTIAEAATNVYTIKPLAVLDLTPLTTSEHLPVRVLGWLAAAFSIAMIGNFFYYWLHRAQHAIPWLWRVHRVHHSITEMSATSSYHHVAEDMLQFACVVLPMAFLLGQIAGPVPWLVLVIVGTQVYYVHSSTRLSIGPLRYVIGDNTFHRIHHSLEERHFDKNFGTITPLWDVLFGTAYFPSKAEWPKVGLSGIAEPKTARQYLMMPFDK